MNPVTEPNHPRQESAFAGVDRASRVEHGTSGKRCSTSSAAVSAIRRPMHEGQMPRLLHANGTRRLSPQRLHCATKKPDSLDPLMIATSAPPYAWSGSQNCSPGHYPDIAAEAQNMLSASLYTKFVSTAGINGTDN